jgi:hypothetical protein
MHDDELRLLVREAVARHLGHVDDRAGGPTRPPSLSAESARTATAVWKSHLSHGRFVFLAPTEPDAPCVVEPEVRCHHCGFCQSYGH